MLQPFQEYYSENDKQKSIGDGKHRCSHDETRPEPFLQEELEYIQFLANPYVGSSDFYRVVVRPKMLPTARDELHRDVMQWQCFAFLVMSESLYGDGFAFGDGAYHEGEERELFPYDRDPGTFVCHANGSNRPCEQGPIVG